VPNDDDEDDDDDDDDHKIETASLIDIFYT
jgi:hypothetical protein